VSPAEVHTEAQAETDAVAEVASADVEIAKIESDTAIGLAQIDARQADPERDAEIAALRDEVPVALPAASLGITSQLVASITATAGTDPYGNAYQAGVTVYGTSGSFAQLTEGISSSRGRRISRALLACWNCRQAPSATATVPQLSAAINLTSADQVQIETLVLNGQTIAVPQTQPASPEAAPSINTANVIRTRTNTALKVSPHDSIS
jgi:hypothetical protein